MTKDEALQMCLEYIETDAHERRYVRWAINEALALTSTKCEVQPTQEPAAWITPDGEGFRIRFSPPTNKVPLGWDALYTTPPQRPWIGLTEEDRREIFDATERDDRGYVAALVEAKLKEKNGL
jgi:hypothetical protein